MTYLARSGAIGALLDEYERALQELQQVLTAFPDATLPRITDPHTPDENCRSVQTILTHVVSSGYGYATSIHNLKGPIRERPAKVPRLTIREYQQDMQAVLAFTEEVLSRFTDPELEELTETRKILTGWGQRYDVEQLLEHAIVHVLRHRRQLEKLIVRTRQV